MKKSYPILYGSKGNLLYWRPANARSVVGWALLLYGAIAMSPLSDDRLLFVQEAPVNGPVIDIWYGDTQEFGNNGEPSSIVLP